MYFVLQFHVLDYIVDHVIMHSCVSTLTTSLADAIVSAIAEAKVGIDVFDTYAPVIDFSTVRLAISLAFGNKWKCFTRIYQWHLQMQWLKKKLTLCSQKIFR